MKTKSGGNPKIQCPQCNTTLSVDELLVSQFEQSIRKDLSAEMLRREEELLEQKQEVKLQSQTLEKEKEDLNSLVNQKVKQQMLTREQILKESIRKEIDAEKSIQLAELEEELGKKSKQLIELNQTKAKMERLTREFEEKEAQIHLDNERKLADRISEMKSSVKNQVQMENDLKIKEKETLIDSLKNKLEEARQKVEQGSMQLQGEAQELVLEELLRNAHPSDQIIEIGKGQRGADCLQIVQTHFGATAGKILYESKNTKTFSSDFVKKLKQDNLTSKADIMVIVTKTMPKEIDGKYGLMDGVWITTMENIRDLSLMLRYGLVKTFSVMQTQEGKKDKMNLLYDYLTSEEFKNTFESILDGFKQLQDSHFDEQRKLQLIWKKREKHLEQVLSSTIEFYGSIKGISGNVPEIKMLEFPKAG